MQAHLPEAVSATAVAESRQVFRVDMQKRYVSFVPSLLTLLRTVLALLAIT